jgi:hypothetical protein
MGARIEDKLILSAQFMGQAEDLFSLGQAVLGDFIIRLNFICPLELSLGASFWADIQESRLGNKKYFYKFFWGLAIPFG